jgi:hypothetical protein
MRTMTSAPFATGCPAPLKGVRSVAVNPGSTALNLISGSALGYWTVSSATQTATINGEPGVIGFLRGEIDFVAAFEVDNGHVRTMRFVRNPDKLRLIAAGVQLI